jgi:hypothetical protein
MAVRWAEKKAARMVVMTKEKGQKEQKVDSA